MLIKKIKKLFWVALATATYSSSALAFNLAQGFADNKIKILMQGAFVTLGTVCIIKMIPDFSEGEFGKIVLKTLGAATLFIAAIMYTDIVNNLPSV